MIQWHELSIWKDSNTCQVQVNGLPGCSWSGALLVSEAGRSLATRLLTQYTTSQITDLFTAARANLMRNDSIIDWVNGFMDKIQRDLVSVTCEA